MSIEGKKRKRGKPRNIHLIKENKLMVTRGQWVDGLKNMMRIKESTCDEHQVLYVSAESLDCVPEANIKPYVN